MRRAHRQGECLLFRREPTLPVTCSCVVDEEVVHDREQPSSEIAAVAPEMKAAPGPLESVLYQVVGSVQISRERPRVATQAGDISRNLFSLAHGFFLGP